jgi:nicotinamide-nucleotide adenylyltransferase
MRALFIGRFQPFHLGHLFILKEILRENEEVIVAIGSAQFSHTVRDPFTAGERFIMIKRACEGAGIDLARVHILPIEDIHRHALWVRHLETLVPTFGRVYANEPLTVRLFVEASYEVRKTEMMRRNEYSGSELRRRMIEGLEWRSLVPPGVAEIIEEIDGERRILDISKSDAK